LDAGLARHAKLERLEAANGTHANEVNWLVARVAAPGAVLPNLTHLALIAHNQWLENIAADQANDHYADKVIRNKPAWLKDTCWDATGAPQVETFTLQGPSVCNTLFPIYSTVRIEAGEPIAGDRLKCHLKPIDDKDYALTFTAQQRARLEAIFPRGVCDYSKPGVKERAIHDEWVDYSQ
jgi:hypothetical protein